MPARMQASSVCKELDRVRRGEANPSRANFNSLIGLPCNADAQIITGFHSMSHGLALRCNLGLT